jgi:D-alanyl-D-alanine carboxypeptidase (penicillin-binding protein 5/6)
MFNILYTIIFVLALPGLFSGNVFGGLGLAKNKVVVINQEPTVLGEENEQSAEVDGSKNATDLTKSMDYPLSLAGTGLVPERKANCTDLKMWAGSSVVIDVDSGTILHYENGRKQTQIASLTKMMTAILTIENIPDLNTAVTIKKEGLRVDGTVVGCPTSVFCNGNRMYAGEKVQAIDLLKATLLNSANDAATSLAIHISGTPENFVDKMNEKAKSMGLIDTHFCTPSGLEIDGRENECYSSAYDIARIAAASMQYELIWDIMKIVEGQFYSTDGKYMHLLKNTDLLLGNISNCLGGKTGFTPLAGKSLLMGSTDPTGKHRVIAVLLNDEKRWDDMRVLLNWVYNSYEWK